MVNRNNNNDREKGNTNRLPLLIDLNIPLNDEEYHDDDDRLINQELGHDARTQPLPFPLLHDILPTPPLESQAQSQLQLLFDHIPQQSYLFNNGHNASYGRSDIRPLAIQATTKKRRNPTQKPKGEGKAETVMVPYPWATNSRAKVQDIKSLIANEISYITGELECKSCTKRYEVKYNLIEKFDEVASFVITNRANMRDRAPRHWMNPTFPTCTYCRAKNSVRPVISDKKRGINWLFLFLGQLIGCCKISALKYFCKHCQIHRTGAKNRLTYLIYIGLCQQLDPDGQYGI